MSYRDYSYAGVIADSINPFGVRLTTMEVTFPRFVLAEFNTHRAFSRNSASSRAIPFDKMRERAATSAFPFLELPAEQPGMSGGADLSDVDDMHAVELLDRIKGNTLALLDEYAMAHPEKSTRVHKSVLNRTLEWCMWHTAIVSATEWDNFFDQRCVPAAQPELRATAELMRTALEESWPVKREYGDLHLPYLSMKERTELGAEEQIKVSVARCARVSYLTHDGERDPSEDIRMFNETLFSHGHWSPMEHVAVATSLPPTSNFGNGWTQVRRFAEVHQWENLLEVAHA